MWAMVTGASSGLGAEYAKILSGKGYDLILVGRSKERLESTSLRLNTASKIEIADLSNEGNINKLYQKYRDSRDLSLIVNCAGFGTFGRILELNTELELNMIKVNINAIYLLTKLFLHKFIKDGRGRIINIASIAGMGHSPLMTTYGATKAFVRSFSGSLNAELRYTNKKEKIRVVTISPGPLNTNFFNYLESKEMYNDALKLKMKKISVDLKKFARKSMNKALKTKNSEVVVGKLSRLLYYVKGTNKFIPNKLIDFIFFSSINQDY